MLLKCDTRGGRPLGTGSCRVHSAGMSRAFVSEPGASNLTRSSEESARNTAEVYRAIEPQFDFEVRQGKRGWMIARLSKDGSFDSWVEE
jgi:hypothetical protein